MAIEQFIEANFRIVIGYLLLMRCGCWICFRASERKRKSSGPLTSRPATELDAGATRADEMQSVRSGDGRFANRLVWLIFLVPMVIYLFAPTVFGESNEEIGALRWLLVVAGVGAVLLYIWSKHVDSGFAEPLAYDEQLKLRSKVPPFRIVRHPVELSNAMLFLVLAVVSGRATVGAFALAAVLVQQLFVISQRDAELKRALGEDFDTYAKSAGRVLPRLPTLRKAQYQVPKRFGLTAIIALLTGLSVLFGGLNLFHYYHPFPNEVYFFAASQIVAICVAQMVFGSAPRMISVLVGAVLFPTFLGIHLYLGEYNLGGRSLVLWLAFGVFLGALIGYCVGGTAAGFFLFTDWLDSWFSRTKKRG